jgi:hypothetical protein
MTEAGAALWLSAAITKNDATLAIIDFAAMFIANSPDNHPIEQPFHPKVLDL